MSEGSIFVFVHRCTPPLLIHRLAVDGAAVPEGREEPRLRFLFPDKLFSSPVTLRVARGRSVRELNFVQYYCKASHNAF